MRKKNIWTDTNGSQELLKIIKQLKERNIKWQNHNLIKVFKKLNIVEKDIIV